MSTAVPVPRPAASRVRAHQREDDDAQQANLGFVTNDVSAAAGGANALLLSNADPNIIRLIGEWKSDEMLRYLHVQALMADYTKRMRYSDEQPPQQPEAGETQDDESSSSPSIAGQQKGDDVDDDNALLVAVDVHDTDVPALVNNIQVEHASNEWCGLIVAGLDRIKPEFSISYPDFDTINVEEQA